MARGGLAALLVVVAISGAVLGSRRHAAAAGEELHVWLHYDYLVGAPDGHSDVPDPAAIQLVVDAYARHGIVLAVDNQHNAIPWKPYISLFSTCDPATTLGLPDVKAQYFHPTSNHEWHYALFGDQISMQCDGVAKLTTGEAELPGDNFIIGLDLFRYIHFGILGVGGTVMHELGHNLGLRHGGSDDVNYKPNYLSVMNYRFQLGGIPYAATPGSIAIVGRRLDYSDAALPTLDKAHLDETLGIQGGPTDTDITTWSAVDSPVNVNGPLFPEGPTSGPLDWNQDGTATDRDVSQDINYFNPPSLSGPFQDYGQLTGFDDWAAIKAYLLGTRDPGPKTIETDGESQEPVITGISPASGLASGGTLVTITGTHLAKVTQVIFGATKATQFTLVNDQTMTAVTPDVSATEPGGAAVDITVVSAAGLPSPSVSADQFTYTSVLPQITSVSPTSGGAGDPITLTGHNFSGATCVTVSIYFCPFFKFTVINDSTITFSYPLSEFPTLSIPETDPLYVLNAYGWGAPSQYTRLPDSIRFPPTLSSFSPSSGPVGTLVTLTGTNLTIPDGGIGDVFFTGCPEGIYGLFPGTPKPTGRSR
jgi:hypothetical protein